MKHKAHHRPPDRPRRRVGRPRRQLDIKRLQALRAAGYSYREISKKAGEPTTTIFSRLHEEAEGEGDAAAKAGDVLECPFCGGALFVEGGAVDEDKDKNEGEKDGAN